MEMCLNTSFRFLFSNFEGLFHFSKKYLEATNLKRKFLPSSFESWTQHYNQNSVAYNAYFFLLSLVKFIFGILSKSHPYYDSIFKFRVSVHEISKEYWKKYYHILLLHKGHCKQEQNIPKGSLLPPVVRCNRWHTAHEQDTWY